MIFRIIKFFITIIIFASLLVFGYLYREDLSNIVYDVLIQQKPCEEPITYFIGDFDSRFKLTKEEAQKQIEQVENIWEEPINKDLFQYSENGEIKINFIYDYRQKATDELKKIGIVINDSKASYNDLKNKYDSLIGSYEKEKAQIDKLILSYNAKKNVFEKEVDYWNKKGGAPKEEYNILERKRLDLNNEIKIINQNEDSFNKLVDTINSVEIVLNRLVNTLNLQVGSYNTINSSTGEEFSEGEYIRDSSGISINIFQFSDKNQLTRVIAHEMGHALEIDHIDNPKAIMYYLNEGVNEKLTEDDLFSLKKVCDIL